MAKGRIQQQGRVQEEKYNYRLNREITVSKIRLVGDNLELVSDIAKKTIEPGVYNTYQVIQRAEELELDVVEISPNADPPVCKIIDYKTFIYDRKKKEKELKAKQSKVVLKEVRFGPNTDDHDFNFKLAHARKFLEEGNKVKAYVFFRGRTIVFKDRGEILLLKFAQELSDIGAVEQLPKLEGKRMIIMINPKKK